MINVDWNSFKTTIVATSMPYKFFNINDSYIIYAYDGNFHLTCIISISDPASSDQIDFETNFKDKAFTTLSQFDTDGASIVRIKAAKKGWSFWAVPIEVTTSTLGGGLYCKDSLGTDIPGITCKIYDGSNIEITTAGLLNANLNTCVKTVIDFEPTFDYEIIGGALRTNSNIGADVRMWIVGAPDIPAIYGGSKEFASGINLKFLAPDSSFEIDGRVTKFLTYNATTHQGKMRIILKHPAGTQLNVQFVVHLYRQ